MARKRGGTLKKLVKAATALLAIAVAALLAVYEQPERETPRPVPTPTSVADNAPCTVAQVSDGDTLRCEDGRRIRLLLIDTPERSQAPFGDQARRELQKLLPVGSETRVELDVRPRDRYGRTLAYVYAPGGKMANREMVRRGYAVVLTYPPNVQHVDDMRAALASAQRARRGLWATSAFDCSPRDYRAKRCR